MLAQNADLRNKIWVIYSGKIKYRRPERERYREAQQSATKTDGRAGLFIHMR